MTLFDIYQGEARDGFIETRIIRAQLKLRFAGTKTAVFKPGMPFEGHIYVMYDDEEALSEEKLAGATLIIRPVVTGTNGQLKTLPDIVVPRQGEYLSDQLDRFQTPYEHWMDRQMEDTQFKRFRKSGVHHFQVLTIQLNDLNGN